MNYQRMADEIPEIFQTTENSKGMIFHEFAIAFTADSNSELDLLFGLLGWARNEAFEKVADTCALWNALVHANTHLATLESKISYISLLCIDTAHTVYKMPSRSVISSMNGFT